MSKHSNNDALSVVQLSRPYLTARQIKALYAQSGNSRDQQGKLLAFSLILSTGNYLRFPIRTIGTAMILFQRFYLFNSLSDFPSTTDTAHACLFVASKMEDTLKKLKDILIASYYIKHPSGPDVNVDSPVIEDQRRRLISLERHVLETMAFDFRVRHPQSYIVKFAHRLSCPASLAETAWMISVDAYRTLVPLKSTAHAIALACIYISSTLLEADTSRINPADFFVDLADYENIILEILELYIDSLPQTVLYARYKDPQKFMSMRIEVNKRYTYSDVSAGDEVRLRDYAIGDKGAVRFVLSVNDIS